MRNIKIQKRVLELTKKIPEGRVASYKEIASVLKIHPRQAARILSKNLDHVRIPCPRVVNADGRIGGYNLGVKKKILLLKKEGVKIINGKIACELFRFAG